MSFDFILGFILNTKQNTEVFSSGDEFRTEVWNELLDIQKKSYESDKSIYNKFDLNNMLPDLKEKNLSWKKLNSKALQTISNDIQMEF